MAEIDIQKLTRPNIRELQPYSSARDEFSDPEAAGILLDANESPFENGVNRYPDPQQKKIKHKLAELKGVRTEQILLGNGSDEVLDLIFRAFCEPGTDNVISLPPTYGMYKVIAGINNVENRTVLLNSNFQPDVDKILQSADANSKILFLCSPNNPTANTFDTGIVRRLIDDFKGLVVIDEAYIDFTGDRGWLPQLRNFPNLIITQTFSKARGMAAIRLGICYASEEIIEILNRIKPPYNVNGLSQEKALKALCNTVDLKNRIKLINRDKELLIKALVDIKFVKKVFPSDANFILVRVDDADRRYQQFIDRGIVVRNRSKQPLCEDCLRITIGTAEENSKLLMCIKDMDI